MIVWLIVGTRPTIKGGFRVLRGATSLRGWSASGAQPLNSICASELVTAGQTEGGTAVVAATGAQVGIGLCEGEQIVCQHIGAQRGL